VAREVLFEEVRDGVAITVSILVPLPPGLRVESQGGGGPTPMTYGAMISCPPRVRGEVQHLLGQLSSVMEALHRAPQGSCLTSRALTLVCSSRQETERVRQLVQRIEDLVEGPARDWGRRMGLFARRDREGQLQLEGWIQERQIRITQLFARPCLAVRTELPEGLVIARKGEGRSAWRCHNPVADMMLVFAGEQVSLASESLEALLPVIHGHPGSHLRDGWLTLQCQHSTPPDDLGGPLDLLLSAIAAL